MNFRIGTGYDVHKIAEGRKLMLGGVEVPSKFGLLGHSDADVILHAITDAILGALCWGDIGSWFPDTDIKYKNIDSKLLLGGVWEKAWKEGWRIVNIDTVILAERPKLRDHIPRMQTAIANVLKTKPDLVSIKATTTETLGFVGRGEGMAAQASVLLSKG